MPRDCYEVYVCNALSWGVLTGIIKPQNRFVIHEAESHLKGSLKPWKFYYADGEENTLPFFGDWIFNDYWKRKTYYGKSAYDKGAAFSRMFKKEIENRGKMLYVR